MPQMIKDVQITGEVPAHYAKILTPEAVVFLEKLHKQFNEKRKSLLNEREKRQLKINQGELPDFLSATSAIRKDAAWKAAPAPLDLRDRKVEITGPAERKMMINALNSGAHVFMADFEDSLTPTWQNLIEGQINLGDAIDRSISFTSPEGKKYTLNEKVAVLMVRPRGWHLPEKHFLINGEPISGSLFDFGLYLFHQAHKLLQNGSGPYFYLPKMENHFEARLWNDVFVFAQEQLGLPKGSIRATVLIETILAAFEMEEILYELREHCVGLNAGRWDYIFSIIKKFQQKEEFIFPDRSQITMTVPFMRAYTELLVKTCHKRGVHAMGGMAAFIPSRKDKAINETALGKVREDKLRESADGFDGTWVAHPDLVGPAKEVFEKVLGKNPNQLEKQKDNIHVVAKDLLDFAIPQGRITEQGLRLNINVALQYMESWLRGIAAVGIYNLMEDAATAEISRAQIWQWIHHPHGRLEDGRKITPDLFRQFSHEELQKITVAHGPGHSGKFEQASRLLDRLAVEKPFIDFLTLAAYDELP